MECSILLSVEKLIVIVLAKSDDMISHQLTYLHPTGGYFKSTGEFTVRYSLENRLLSGGRLSKIRTVHVVDVDECTYAGPHLEVRKKKRTCRRGGASIIRARVFNIVVSSW